MNIANEDDDNDINLETLEFFIKEEQKRLEKDKSTLQSNIQNSKKRRSDGNHNQPLYNNDLPKNKYDPSLNTFNVKTPGIEKSSFKDKSTIFMIRNFREEEKDKFIEKISKPKEDSYFPNNKDKKFYPQSRGDFSQHITPVDIRQKNKDKLAEKLASSEWPLSKPSYRQLAKNLHSSIFPNSCTHYNNLEKTNHSKSNLANVTNSSLYDDERNKNIENEQYLRSKYNIPRIVISDYKENSCSKVESIVDPKENAMVRIGEFSPLNPNLPGGRTVLGLGEWEEKRQLLLQKYKQVSRSPSPVESDINHKTRSIATQTNLEDDWSLSHSVDKSSELLHGCSYTDKERECVSPQPRLSPIPKCFNGMNEKEVKEFLYREELRKQIEEKNRLKEEIKRKEAEEEARIEAKIQKDIEKMRKQFEEERLLRMELAIRRQEQEDLLWQRLAIEKQKTAQESKSKKKKTLRNSTSPNFTHKQNEKSTQSDLRRGPSHSNAVKEPTSSVSQQSVTSVLSNVHEELRKPLLQASDNVQYTERLSTSPGEERTSVNEGKMSPSLRPASPPIRRSREVDVLAQKAVFDTDQRTAQRRLNHNTADTMRDRLKEVDNMLKQPLLPETHQFLPPVSQPLLHATIPPLSASLQVAPPKRSNVAVIEEKWKVPNVEHDNEAVSNTKNNPRILTQLGIFRRHLQEESLRMRQRVREDSP